MKRLIRLVDFVIYCDRCDDQDNSLEHSSNGEEPQSERAAIKLFREFGWRIGKEAICPHCISKET